MLTKLLKRLFSIILCISILSLNIYGSSDTQEKIALGVGTFGAGLLGGFALSSLFTSKSDKDILNGSTECLKLSKQFNDKIRILDSYYNLNKNLKNGNKIIINEIDEELNYDLASTGLLIDDNFNSSLSNLISDLKYYQSKIPKRINKLKHKLKRNKNNKEYLETISNLEIQQEPIAKQLPTLEFLKNFINGRYDYFQTYSSLVNITELYDKEINCLEKLIGNKLSSEITRCARSKFSEHSLYPCIKFIEQIDTDIYAIERKIKKLPNYYRNLKADARELIDYLQEIRSVVVGDPYYSQERRDWNNQYAPKTFFGLTYTVC